jgi:WD40 repeat protein
MNKISYFSDMNYNYKMKNILAFADNGDFIIYSSVSVNLFSINGVPLCELNLLNESYNISKITYCVSSFSGDILLFTGHKDGSVIIWKIKTIKSNEKDIFLHEYDYNYSFDFDKAKIKNYILRRKFEMITKVEQSDDMKIPIKYMQISNDINYMLIINKNKNIFILSGKTDDENNINSKKELDNLDKSGENKKKIICKICKKEYEENQYEQNNLENLENKNEITKKATDSDFEIVDKFILYDKIIEDKGKIENENICINCQMNLENFLYNC